MAHDSLDRPAFEITEKMRQEVLYEIRLWDQGRSFSVDELIKRLRLAIIQS